MSNRKVLINLVLDKSGSMESIQDSTIGAVNEYISKLKADGANSYNFSLTLFDTEVRKPYQNVPLSSVSDITREIYRPEGNTALYDAVCDTIDSVKAVAADEKVLFVIMTDGEENSSRRYNERDLKNRIESLTRGGSWTFVFLGANQDSFAKAGSWGVSSMNISNFAATDKGIRRSMSTLAQNTAMYASSASASTADFFSKEDQQDLQDTR